jgi:hypothetical protein
MSHSNGEDPKINLNTKAHITESVYFASEEFNALRKELYDNWRMDPALDPTGANSLWYYSGLMVQDPPSFVEIMNLELGLTIVFDSGNEKNICLEILNALRKKRGVSEFKGH